jgi:predicted RNase H-like HicB family nuclease
MRYVAVVVEDAESEFMVHFPDLPGCFTRGATHEQACRFAAETLAFHLERFAVNGAPAPETRSLEAIRAQPEHRDATLVLVEAMAQARAASTSRRAFVASPLHPPRRRKNPCVNAVRLRQPGHDTRLHCILCESFLPAPTAAAIAQEPDAVCLRCWTLSPDERRLLRDRAMVRVLRGDYTR